MEPYRKNLVTGLDNLVVISPFTKIQNIGSRTYMGREDGEWSFALFKFTIPVKLSGDVHWAIGYAGVE